MGFEKDDIFIVYTNKTDRISYIRRGDKEQGDFDLNFSYQNTIKDNIHIINSLFLLIQFFPNFMIEFI